MTVLVVAVFAATYLGMALGGVPGLRLDRSGIALMALAVLLATGALDIAGFARAVDAPTIMLLFALMIVSAQFAGAGFYDLCARAITGAAAGPSGLLALIIAVAGGLSALLANDIVVYAMTPLLCAGIAGRGRDPRPYLMALAGAANAGSAATVIGNPQNILIGQLGRLDFWQFLAVCAIPSAAALAIVFVTVRLVWRRELSASHPARDNGAATAVVDRWQTIKGAAAALVMVGLFATPMPREIAALAVAAVLLASRRLASREMIGAVDWHLLLLFACLFAVTATFAHTGLARDALVWLEAHGYLPDRIAVLAPLSLVMSNTIGNVPSVILLMAVWPHPEPGALYGLALLTTLAGNFLIVGSLANLIVAERAASAGIRVSFADFARAGVPMTLASMAVAVLWLGFGGWMRWI